jgi:hypothetical protein
LLVTNQLTRLAQIGLAFLTLFVALQLIERAVAQRNAEIRSTISIAKTPVGASPMASCDYCCLYDQYNSAATEPPLGIDSQQFEPAMATLDDQAADDFVLTTGIGAIYMTGLRVMGDYSAGGGPASSFNVYFYQNGSGNFPGAAIAQFMDLPYTGTPPEFVICLPYLFHISPGTYWISVQANQDFNPNGQWFWRNRTIQSRSGAVWQNPANGYGTGCVTWNRKSACMPDQVWPDQVFQILGFREGPTPSPKPISTPRPRPTPAPRPTP